MIGRLLASVSTLLLAGCLMLGPPPVGGPESAVVDATADARLRTTVKSGLFLTRARIGDREAGPFLIDTGASDLLLDVKLAEALKLTFWGASDHPELKQKVRFGTVASFEVGPLALRNTKVAVLDLSVVTDAFDGRLAGILGYPFFARTVVEVDYGKRSVSCFDPASYRLPRGEWLPLTLKGNHAGVMARLEGNAEGLFLLDTGSTHTVLFFADFIQKSRLLEIRKMSKARDLRLSGEHEVFAGRIAWFELAGRRFDNPSVSFRSPSAPEIQRFDGFDGIIGAGFMREFTVVFNYPAGKIAFLRR